MAQDVSDLQGFQPRIHRDRDEPGFENTPQELHGFDGVRPMHRHALAWSQPLAEKPVRQRGGGLIQRLVRDLSVPALERCLPRVPFRLNAKSIAEVHGAGLYPVVPSKYQLF